MSHLLENRTQKFFGGVVLFGGNIEGYENYSGGIFESEDFSCGWYVFGAVIILVSIRVDGQC